MRFRLSRTGENCVLDVFGRDDAMEETRPIDQATRGCRSSWRKSTRATRTSRSQLDDLISTPASTQADGKMPEKGERERWLTWASTRQDIRVAADSWRDTRAQVRRSRQVRNGRRTGTMCRSSRISPTPLMTTTTRSRSTTATTSCSRRAPASARWCGPRSPVKSWGSRRDVAAGSARSLKYTKWKETYDRADEVSWSVRRGNKVKCQGEPKLKFSSFFWPRYSNACIFREEWLMLIREI